MPIEKDTIIKQLKEEIINLTLKPGDLISEAILTDRFGLSRTPIRDVLKQLASEGYINIYPQKGSIISYIDLHSVEQLIYLRNALEKEIFKDLKNNLTLSMSIELTSILEEQRTCIQESHIVEKFMFLDDKFHQTCFKFVNRSFLWDMIQQFNVHYVRYRKLHMLDNGKLSTLISEHQNLLDYLKGTNSDSIELIIHRHIRADVDSEVFSKEYMHYLLPS